MIKQYFIQAIHLLKENKLISWISIAGTALAIAMIMVIVLGLRVETANYLPENKRDRTLYVKWMSVRWKNGNGQSNGTMSVRTAKECFKALTTPEAVAIISWRDEQLALSPEGELSNVDVLQTDEAFWKVYDFSFLDGKPYDLADVESGLSKAVITESVARKLFGETDVVGRIMQINYVDYTVTGVVKDVNELASTAYADVWIPYSSTNLAEMTGLFNTLGYVRVVILAHSSKDFAAIREESERLKNKYNDQLTEVEVHYQEQPDIQFVYNNRKWANEVPDMKRIVAQLIIVILLMLLVPAINLSSMTLSRMRKRYSEIGVRKAFGATKSELLGQILMENLVLTIIGGVAGLLVTWGAAFVLKDFLFDNATLSLSMILDPVIFLLAFVFCLILNLLSAGIPAWRAARMNIVEALTS